jgi:hypothetical protein
MFWPLLAIIRSNSQHYTGIIFHMLLLSIDCYYSIIKALITLRETVSTVSLFNCQTLYIDY